MPALVACAQASAETINIDRTCTQVRQVFFGVDDIAHKGNTKIVPFSKTYRNQLAGYFERGCPMNENFPMPPHGTDMQLAVTVGDIVVSGKIKLEFGKPLLR
ncbi:hypothetical protein [uncultured Bradyrhizobium sp.]|uniref:hypothetical protein n=1 Tax=uncultured Bradyrhizobium sp. TaxID=199684 RepID=UPI0035CAEB47